MRVSVISLTEKGRLISMSLAQNLSSYSVKRYCFSKHSDDGAETFYSISELTESIFSNSDALVFVCACGIAVRSTAPHIRSKLTDPAVIVIDDCGKYVIPLLSGHIGGANSLSLLIADKLGAQPVITTATDTGGHFSPDCFATANGLIISDMTVCKEIASAVLDGEKIGFESEYEYINMPDEVTEKRCRCGIFVGRSTDRKPFPITLSLMPRNIVVGIGCRRGVSVQAVEKAVRTALDGVVFERISGVATVDIKSDESGLIEFCKKYRLSISFYTPQELMEVEGDFSRSDFVRSITGTDNVCERSAVKLSRGKLVSRKSVLDGVTVALAETPVLIDFNRRQKGL